MGRKKRDSIGVETRAQDLDIDLEVHSDSTSFLPFNAGLTGVFVFDRFIALFKEALRNNLPQLGAMKPTHIRRLQQVHNVH